MSLKYPRRVKDLPRLETDSEDEGTTPFKDKSNRCSSSAAISDKDWQQQLDSCNKENRLYCGNNTKGAFNIFRNFPKRSSELPALESDSEEEEDDILRDGTLNCAILNESSLLTPAKDEPDYDDSLCLKFQSPKRETFNTKNPEANSANLSLISRFDELGLKCNGSVIATNSVTSSSASTQPINANSCISTMALNSITESAALASVQRFNSEPLQNTAAEAAQFATPQIRSFSVQRRPHNIPTMQTQKARTAICNEFRFQKVLFQTPMHITRAPRTCLPNDSLTLSLYDSINEQNADTPNTTEKDSPQHSTAASLSPAATKYKKSLQVAFSSLEEKSSNAAAVEAISDVETSKDKYSEKDNTAERFETIIQINGSKYGIIQKLGAGASSSVYLAQRKDNGKECALKIVDLHGQAAIVEGYLNETKLLEKLQGNVCVVSLYEYELMQKESRLYMVMEKGDSDLNKVLQNCKTDLPLYVLMNYWYQILQAVNYIHQNGVIHSDLKPANFLMINGRLKLIDFGVASNIAVDSTSIIKFSHAGTFNYISPEALTDISTGTSPNKNQPKIKISTKSDVWSLGCMLYMFIYKKTPFSHIHSMYAKISAITNPKSTIDYPLMPPFYPPMLLHMVKSCLQHNPKQRPSCAELLQYPFHMVIPLHNLAVSQK